MVGGALLLLVLPALVSSAGEGNIRLLEDEVAMAFKACIFQSKDANDSNRQRRSEDYPRIDNTRQRNQYGHERRNASDTRELNIYVLNATDYDYGGYGTGNGGEKIITSAPRPAGSVSTNSSMDSGNYTSNRTRRSEPLVNKPDTDQCLSQCVFANLQVVDSRGIPREAELWNKVQTSVTSQQSKAALRDQIRACFQELQSGGGSKPLKRTRSRTASPTLPARKEWEKNPCVICVIPYESFELLPYKFSLKMLLVEAKHVSRAKLSVLMQPHRMDQHRQEAEDNECSYSNKLERCLMLRFADRKTDDTGKSAST